MTAEQGRGPVGRLSAGFLFLLPLLRTSMGSFLRSRLDASLFLLPNKEPDADIQHAALGGSENKQELEGCLWGLKIAA